MEESSNQDLASYLTANPVPCFAHVTRGSRQTQHGVSNHRSNEAAAVDHCDVVYLYKEFTARCLFAKSYSNMFENYLLHHRPSYVPSEDEFSSSGNEMSSATRDKLHHTLRSDIFVFNDIVTIPFNYPGLFEVFSSNSVKRGGILDHETDLISFASRLRKPKSYYVAKEMKVYELITNPSSSPTLQSQSNQQNAPTNKTDSISTMSPVSQQVISVSKRNLSRKWSRIPVGSVCRAVRLVSLDGCTNNVIENKHHHGGGIHTPFWLLHVIKQLLCCQFEKKAKKNSDLAIELKLVKQLSDLDVSSGNTSKLDNDKTYFLPVYESAALENEIDLIPLSTFKNNRFKSNCLHLARNFVLNDQFLLGNYIELKLFDENPFNKALSIKGDMKKQPPPPPPPKSPQTQNSLVNSNQHIEKDKYISIFDLIEYRAQCKFVVGFNLTNNTLFVIPNIPVDSEKFLRIKPRFSRLNQVDAQTKTMLESFTSAPNMNAFISAAQLEIDKFDNSLNRIEIFDNSDFVHSNDEKEADGDVNSSPKPNIIKHFSDLVNVDSEDHQSDHTGSDEFKSASEIQEKLSDRKMSRIKYRTMPMKNSSGYKMSRNEMNRANSLNNFNIISL